jgi:hypothetical protein
MPYVNASQDITMTSSILGRFSRTFALTLGIGLASAPIVFAQTTQTTTTDKTYNADGSTSSSTSVVTQPTVMTAPTASTTTTTTVQPNATGGTDTYSTTKTQ